MKILILGGSGMLGHRLWIELSKAHEVWVTVRSSASSLPDLTGVNRRNIRASVDMLDFDNVIRAFASIRPELVINCVGLVKQHPMSNDPLSVIELNARLPHRLSLVCRTGGIRLIHISTDCVFSGKIGNYIENSVSDAEDLYGKSKALGEVSYPHTLTVRTSIIGRELRTRLGLTEWFLAQKGSVKGFTNAVFSGFTTQAFAKALLAYVIPRADLNGVWQVSSDAISKYDLLCLMRESYHRDIEIIPDGAFMCDRSLDSKRFRTETGFVPPSWQAMIEEMAACPLPYDEWKR
jgi:dTDP-4-dehydrorhamnose reductase